MEIILKVSMIFWLLAASIMDIRSRRISIRMLAAGGVLSVLTVICQCSGYWAVLKGMLPGILLLLTAFATRKAGYGDGVALLCLGAAAGGEKAFLLFGLSLFLLSFVSLLLLALRKVRRNTQIPFLPFLTAAWLLLMGL